MPTLTGRVAGFFCSGGPPIRIGWPWSNTRNGPRTSNRMAPPRRASLRPAAARFMIDRASVSRVNTVVLSAGFGRLGPGRRDGNRSATGMASRTGFGGGSADRRSDYRLATVPRQPFTSRAPRSRDHTGRRAMTWTYGLLGSVVVRAPGSTITISASRSRTLFVMLVLNPGRTISQASLTEAIWDTEPPASFVANLRTYAHRLRRELGVLGVAVQARNGGGPLGATPGEGEHRRVSHLSGRGPRFPAQGDAPRRVAHP